MRSEPDLLAQFNHDILLKLFEVLSPKEGLISLSATCRWLRDASSPILFRSCYQRLGPSLRNGATYEILPSTLWSHVRVLRISCFCLPHSITNVEDPLLCGALSTIHTVLPALSRLTTLHLRVRYIDVHGISWKSMRTILSLPHLLHLHMDRFYICPELLDSDSFDDLDGSTVAPLATFHYTLPHYRQPWSFPSEAATLELLVRRLHTSLQSLMLPVESAPIRMISSLNWPRLRMFTLRGEHWPDPMTPIVALFSSMPSLLSLALELSEPKNVSVLGSKVIWPAGLSATLPWPNLETLCISHPDPADNLYANLPSAFRTLSLRSWPHECIQIFDENQAYQPSSWYEGRKHRRARWDCPLLTPENLSLVLRKCDCPLLSTLELEYRVDAHESELLRTLAVKFPHLTTLEVHRYRGHGEYRRVEVTDFAEALASLTSLRILKLHLDFDRMPGPKPGRMMVPRYMPPPSDPPTFDDTLASAAEELSQTLSPSLEEIWMFKYEYEPLWLVFTVTRVCLDGKLQIRVVAQEDCRCY